MPRHDSRGPSLRGSRTQNQCDEHLPGSDNCQSLPTAWLSTDKLHATDHGLTFVRALLCMSLRSIPAMKEWEKKCNQCGQVSCCSDVGRSDIPWASTNNMSYFLLFSFFSRHELYSMLPSCHPACRSAKLLISESCFYCSPPASCTLCKMRIKTDKQTAC